MAQIAQHKVQHHFHQFCVNIFIFIFIFIFFFICLFFFCYTVISPWDAFFLLCWHELCLKLRQKKSMYKHKRSAINMQCNTQHLQTHTHSSYIPSKQKGRQETTMHVSKKKDDIKKPCFLKKKKKKQKSFSLWKTMIFGGIKLFCMEKQSTCDWQKNKTKKPNKPKKKNNLYLNISYKKIHSIQDVMDLIVYQQKCPLQCLQKCLQKYPQLKEHRSHPCHPQIQTQLRCQQMKEHRNHQKHQQMNQQVFFFFFYFKCGVLYVCVGVGG